MMNLLWWQLYNKLTLLIHLNARKLLQCYLNLQFCNDYIYSMELVMFVIQNSITCYLLMCFNFQHSHHLVVDLSLYQMELGAFCFIFNHVFIGSGKQFFLHQQNKTVTSCNIAKGCS